ncbi:protein of unknown function [Burkholderia multivorans]
MRKCEFFWPEMAFKREAIERAGSRRVPITVGGQAAGVTFRYPRCTGERERWLSSTHGHVLAETFVMRSTQDASGVLSACGVRPAVTRQAGRGARPVTRKAARGRSNGIARSARRTACSLDVCGASVF